MTDYEKEEWERQNRPARPIPPGTRDRQVPKCTAGSGRTPPVAAADGSVGHGGAG